MHAYIQPRARIGVRKLMALMAMAGSPLLYSLDVLAATATYQQSTADIPNPERGIYHHDSDCNRKVWDNAFFNDIREHYPNRTVVMCVFYLNYQKEDKNSELTFEVDFFKAQAAAARTNKFKMIVRFGYFDCTAQEQIEKLTNPNIDCDVKGSTDASLPWIEAHLDTLRDALIEYKDVIAFVQAGFIGQWGEWHGSAHFAHNGDFANRRKVIDKIRSILPQHMVQVRSPFFKMKMYPELIDANFAAAGPPKIGHHNDCFLATPDDKGTYVNVADPTIAMQKEFLAKDTVNLAMGGETCQISVPDPTRSQCDNAKVELALYHYTYLNGVYSADVLNSWVAGDCMEEIKQRLGYRLSLVESTFPSIVKRKSMLSANIKIKNTGYAAPVNNRSAYLVLRNRATRVIAVRQLLTSNPRNWQPGTVITIPISAYIPASATAAVGEYDVFVSMADPNPALSAPEYAIQFANPGVWDTEPGLNQLQHTVQIIRADDEPAPVFPGNRQPLPPTPPVKG
jgi:hypothetical protein